MGAGAGSATGDVCLNNRKGEAMTAPEYKDFEDYLQECHIKENPHLLDDDIPDAFSDWLSDLDTDEWIRLGDSYKRIL